jgi:hypothetical protein
VQRDFAATLDGLAWTPLTPCGAFWMAESRAAAASSRSEVGNCSIASFTPAPSSTADTLTFQRARGPARDRRQAVAQMTYSPKISVRSMRFMFYPRPLEFEIAQQSGERCARRCVRIVQVALRQKKAPRGGGGAPARGINTVGKGALGGGPKCPTVREESGVHGIKVRFQLDESSPRR